MALYLLHAESVAYVPNLRPTTAATLPPPATLEAAVHDALASVNVGTPEDVATLAGAVRVVRTAASPGPTLYQHVAAVVAARDAATATRAAAKLRALLGAPAPEFAWTASAAPFEPLLNGPLAWWQDGKAAATPTRDATTVGAVERAQPLWPDNPTGPSAELAKAGAPDGASAPRPTPTSDAPVAAAERRLPRGTGWALLGFAVAAGATWLLAHAGRAGP